MGYRIDPGPPGAGFNWYTRLIERSLVCADEGQRGGAVGASRAKDPRGKRDPEGAEEVQSDTCPQIMAAQGANGFIEMFRLATNSQSFLRDANRIRSRAWELFDHRQYPRGSQERADVDMARHVYASAELAKLWGERAASFAGAGNELQGLVLDLLNLPSRLSGESDWAFQISDFIANDAGFDSANLARCTR